jgi:hypothetical protein
MEALQCRKLELNSYKKIAEKVGNKVSVCMCPGLYLYISILKKILYRDM